MTEFGYDFNRGWVLRSINQKPPARGLADISMSEYTSGSGAHGWELVSTTTSVGPNESKKRASLADMAGYLQGKVGPDELEQRLLLVFKRPKLKQTGNT